MVHPPVISPALYRDEARNLTFQLHEGLSLCSSSISFVLRGENGVGKTRFVEHVILPFVARQKCPAVYVGPDRDRQLASTVAWVNIHRALKGGAPVSRRGAAETAVERSASLLLRELHSVGCILVDEFEPPHFPLLTLARALHPASSLLLITHAAEVERDLAALTNQNIVSLEATREGDICHLRLKV